MIRERRMVRDEDRDTRRNEGELSRKKMMARDGKGETRARDTRRDEGELSRE